MGITASLPDMSFWQYRAIIKGWNKAHQPEEEKKKVPAMKPERFHELVQKFQDHKKSQSAMKTLPA